MVKQVPEAEIVIVANAFGVDSVWRSGQSAWLGVAAQAGAQGFEVRRELFATDADASHEALARLGAEARRRGLWCVYSTPACLYIDGRLDYCALETALAEADALGARFVKLQLGTFAGRANAAAIARICVVSDAASRFTLSVKSRHVPEAPGTFA